MAETSAAWPQAASIAPLWTISALALALVAAKLATMLSSPLILAALLLAESPEVAHERIDDGHYRLRLSLTGAADLAAAQRAMVPAAIRLCAGLVPRFGTYRWDALERAGPADTSVRPVSMTLEQELHCGGEAPPAMAAAPPDPAWRPTPAQQQAVLEATDAFFAARESGRYEEAYRMLGQNMRNQQPEAFAEAARVSNAQWGRRRSRRNVAVTWYNNPPHAPVPGIYAAVDFVGAYDNLHLMCGYVTWLLQPDGTWRIVTLDEGVLARADSPDPTAADLARVRTLMRCRD
jgi:hypothetical protein